MGEGCDVAALPAPRRGAQGDGGSGGRVAPAGSAGGTVATGSLSSSSMFSWASGLTDDGDVEDDATSSPPAPGRRVSSSSLSSLTSTESDTMQTGGGAGGGPLYELSMMLDHLPALRTGLSKYYQGRSQSFTSLADVSCVEDLAKKTTPYIRRKKASRGCAATLGAKNRLSRMIAKRSPRGSPDRPMSRVRSTGLSRSSGKPPA
ncbi:hypothetical protein ACP70R_043210 [Stipagrostis hirtigluma subsp. patula]